MMETNLELCLECMCPCTCQELSQFCIAVVIPYKTFVGKYDAFLPVDWTWWHILVYLHNVKKLNISTYWMNMNLFMAAQILKKSDS